MKETNSDDPLPQQLKSPSPPRWRFVSVAKKSSGYSSLAAGHAVDGLSAEELAAEYIPPPEVEVPHPKTVEDRNVGKLETKEFETVYRYCGGRDFSDDVISSSSKHEPNSDPAFVPDDIKEVVKIESTSSDAEEELKTQPTETTDRDVEDVFVDIPLDESISIDHKEDLDSNAKELNGNSRKKRHRASLFVLTMLLMMVILGVSLGNNKPTQIKESEPADTSFSSDSALMNNTSNPSETLSAFPSISPSKNQFEVTERIPTHPCIGLSKVLTLFCNSSILPATDLLKYQQCISE